MEDLQSRFNAYLAGNPALQTQISKNGATLEEAQGYADTLEECISSGLKGAGLPFEVEYSVSAPTVSGTGIEITGDLATVEHSSWGSGGPARLTELFNHGYELKSAILPWGPWGTDGKWGRAMPARGGLFFVQEIVANFKAKVPDNVSISYDNKKYD
jgi:hypothetical protein